MGKYVSQKRILIRYEDEGGREKEGVIEMRKGLSDINIGKRSYAMVRIPIFKHWYIKGMAMYSDNIPEGYDIIFYTSKPKGTPLKTNDMTKVGKCVYKYSPEEMPSIQMVNYELIDRNDSSIPKLAFDWEAKPIHLTDMTPKKKEEKVTYIVTLFPVNRDDCEIRMHSCAVQITATKPVNYGLLEKKAVEFMAPVAEMRPTQIREVGFYGV